MDKKDIYEHLAKIYLDASSDKKKKKPATRISIGLILAVLSIIFVSIAVIFSQGQRKTLLNSQIALVLQPDLARINFHFDPARKEIYTVNLNRLNLANYRTLVFSVKKSEYQLDAAIRVEFVNAYREKSEFYLEGLSHKWRECRIGFAQFKKITDWSEMTELSFIVEEWNVRDKKGVVYIDNVYLLR